MEEVRRRSSRGRVVLMRYTFLALALLMAAPLHGATTVKLFNGMRHEVEAVWTRLTPTPAAPQRVRLAHEESFDTGIAVGNGEGYSIAFRRNGVDVAKPVVGTNFEIAMLLQPRGRRAYVALRPVYDERRRGEVGDALNLSGDDRPSSLYCITIDVRRWNGRQVVVLANGFFMELTGGTGATVEEGRHCFCGRGLSPDGKAGGLDRFEVSGTCPLSGVR